MRITKYGRLFVIKKDGTCYMHGVRKGWIKAPTDTSGYLRFCIDYGGKTKAVFVHRLIAEAFVPNPNGYTQVNHKDEDKKNNHHSNLEWCTPKYNSEYSRRLHSERERERWHKAGVASGRTRAKRICAYKDGVLVAEYESVEAAARAMGCCRKTISSVANGEYGRKTARGFKWAYANGAQMPYEEGGEK